MAGINIEGVATPAEGAPSAAGRPGTDLATLEQARAASLNANKSPGAQAVQASMSAHFAQQNAASTYRMYSGGGGNFGGGGSGGYGGGSGGGGGSGASGGNASNAAAALAQMLGYLRDIAQSSRATAASVSGLRGNMGGSAAGGGGGSTINNTTMMFMGGGGGPSGRGGGAGAGGAASSGAGRDIRRLTHGAGGSVAALGDFVGGLAELRIAGSALAGLGPVGLGVAGVAAAAGVALAAPMAYAKIMGAGASASQEYWDYNDQVRGLASAGGMSGDELNNTIRPSYFKAPDWARKLGMGSQDIAQTIQNYGVVKPTVEENMGTAYDISRMKWNPAMRGMSAEQIANFTTMTGAMGMRLGDARDRNPDGSINTRELSGDKPGVDVQLIEAMARAQELGLNRSTVMQSISSGIQSMAKTGGGADVTNVDNALMKYVGTPGGNTGEVGLSVMQKGADFENKVGTDVGASLANAEAFKDVHSVAEYKAFVDKSAGAGTFDRAAANNPALVKNVQTFVSSKYDLARVRGLALETGNNFPGVASDISQNYGPGILRGDPGLTLLSRSGQSGNNPDVVTQGDINAEKAGQGGNIGSKSLVPGNAQKMYEDARKLGYSDADAKALVAASVAESGNLDPMRRTMDADGKGGYAAGLFGDRGPRRADFKKMFGYEMGDPKISQDQQLYDQLKFFQWEQNNTEKQFGLNRDMASTTDVGEKAAFIVKDTLRPGAHDLPGESAHARQAANSTIIRSLGGPDTSGQESQNQAKSDARSATLTGSGAAATEFEFLDQGIDKMISVLYDIKQGLQSHTPASTVPGGAPT